MSKKHSPPPLAKFCTVQNDTYPYIDPTKADLSGKYVLVTGATRGVGKAMVISYAKAGASGIALAARSDTAGVVQEALAAARSAGRSSDPKLLSIKMDITSESDVEAAARTVAAEFGKLDILINNAGYLEEWHPVADTKPAEWWRTFEVNVKGPYLASRAFIPLLMKGNDKTIVQVASLGAISRVKGASAYQTSKTALVRFNNYLHDEYSEQGLLAYSIHPGGVKTDLAFGMPEYMHAILNDTPELCGDTVVWLTKEKRDWLADRFVSVGWQMDEFLSKKDEIVERDLLKFKMMS